MKNILTAVALVAMAGPAYAQSIGVGNNFDPTRDEIGIARDGILEGYATVESYDNYWASQSELDAAIAADQDTDPENELGVLGESVGDLTYDPDGIGPLAPTSITLPVSDPTDGSYDFTTAADEDGAITVTAPGGASFGPVYLGPHIPDTDTTLLDIGAPADGFIFVSDDPASMGGGGAGEWLDPATFFVDTDTISDPTDGTYDFVPTVNGDGSTTLTAPGGATATIPAPDDDQVMAYGNGASPTDGLVIDGPIGASNNYRFNLDYPNMIDSDAANELSVGPNGKLFYSHTPSDPTDGSYDPVITSSGGEDTLTFPGGETWTHTPSTPFDDTALLAATAANAAAIAALPANTDVTAVDYIETYAADGTYSTQIDVVEDGVTVTDTVTSYNSVIPFVDSGDGCTPVPYAGPNAPVHTTNLKGDLWAWDGAAWSLESVSAASKELSINQYSLGSVSTTFDEAALAPLVGIGEQIVVRASRSYTNSDCVDHKFMAYARAAVSFDNFAEDAIGVWQIEAGPDHTAGPWVGQTNSKLSGARDINDYLRTDRSGTVAPGQTVVFEFQLTLNIGTLGAVPTGISTASWAGATGRIEFWRDSGIAF